MQAIHYSIHNTHQISQYNTSGDVPFGRNNSHTPDAQKFKNSHPQDSHEFCLKPLQVQETWVGKVAIPETLPLQLRKNDPILSMVSYASLSWRVAVLFSSKKSAPYSRYPLSVYAQSLASTPTLAMCISTFCLPLSIPSPAGSVTN